jgi:hypothetical protein
MMRRHDPLVPKLSEVPHTVLPLYTLAHPVTRRAFGRRLEERSMGGAAACWQVVTWGRSR